MGRRKIEMKLVKDTNTRQVTFSKRRNGLFKKANELSILCAVEVAIVVFSPGNRPYSFGHPGVDAVAGKYLVDNEEDQDDAAAAAAGDADVERLNQTYVNVMEELRQAEEEGAVRENELVDVENRMAMRRLEEAYDAHVELKGMLKERLFELETAEAMLLLARKPVVGIRKAKRRRRAYA